MAKTNIIKGLAESVKEKAEGIDAKTLKEKAAAAGSFVAEKAGEAKDKAMDVKEDITEKLTELDRLLEFSITEYNDTFTLMNDKGLQLYIERSRSTDSITFTENLINSIANHPKKFDTELQEVDQYRKEFLDSCAFAAKELQEARKAAGGAGAGLAAGASVAFMAPSAAMWIATTFGTASTGAAISTLTGAAAKSAALAWLGGGALAAGGGGTAAGSALLAMAGPIGWTIAGASLLSSILLFASKRNKLNKQKNEEIESVKRNTEAVKEMDARISALLDKTVDIRKLQGQSYMDCMKYFDKDYATFTDEDKTKLGALVNYTKSMAALFEETIA